MLGVRVISAFLQDHPPPISYLRMFRKADIPYLSGDNIDYFGIEIHAINHTNKCKKLRK